MDKEKKKRGDKTTRRMGTFSHKNRDNKLTFNLNHFIHDTIYIYINNKRKRKKG